MPTPPVIEVSGLGKCYQVGNLVTARKVFGGLARRLRRAPSANGSSSGSHAFWALRNLSFTLEEGQVLGVIGRNGAGKSTLLKILSRIVTPTEGTATIRGRVASLLEVGTGFHPEMTGRENIYLNGSILGLTQAEIRSKIDAIVDFAETHEFLETPVKRYSSGMRVRLAFAVAAHLDPEILIVDEVLAVGDARFQSRCLAKLKDVSSSGRTVLFVSHNMTAVTAFCDRVLYLKDGSSVFHGPTSDGIARYLGDNREQSTTALVDRTDRDGSGRFRFTRVVVSPRTGSAGITVADDLILTFEYTAHDRITDLNVGFNIKSALGTLVFRIMSKDTTTTPLAADGAGRFQCRLRSPRLRPGEYWITITSWSDGQSELLDRVIDAAMFSVHATDLYGTGRLPDDGVTLPACEWS